MWGLKAMGRPPLVKPLFVVACLKHLAFSRTVGRIFSPGVILGVLLRGSRLSLDRPGLPMVVQVGHARFNNTFLRAFCGSHAPLGAGLSLSF